MLLWQISMEWRSIYSCVVRPWTQTPEGSCSALLSTPSPCFQKSSHSIDSFNLIFSANWECKVNSAVICTSLAICGSPRLFWIVTGARGTREDQSIDTGHKQHLVPHGSQLWRWYVDGLAGLWLLVSLGNKWCGPRNAELAELEIAVLGNLKLTRR